MRYRLLILSALALTAVRSLAETLPACVVDDSPKPDLAAFGNFHEYRVHPGPVKSALALAVALLASQPQPPRGNPLAEALKKLGASVERNQACFPSLSISAAPFTSAAICVSDQRLRLEPQDEYWKRSGWKPSDPYPVCNQDTECTSLISLNLSGGGWNGSLSLGPNGLALPGRRGVESRDFAQALAVIIEDSNAGVLDGSKIMAQPAVAMLVSKMTARLTGLQKELDDARVLLEKNGFSSDMTPGFETFKKRQGWVELEVARAKGSDMAECMDYQGSDICSEIDVYATSTIEGVKIDPDAMRQHFRSLAELQAATKDFTDFSGLFPFLSRI